MTKLAGFLLSCMFFIGCMTPTTQQPIRYVALGDSYTIGQGVNESERWPNLLVNELNKNGIAIELVANPSQTGWTTQHVIDYELPVMIKEDANFVTLLIGVNDYVQGVSSEAFTTNVATILDNILVQVGSPDRVVVITIPDFGVTPAAAYFNTPTSISAGIAEFNTLLTQEATQRNIPVVDIYTLSQGMTKGSNLVLEDGIHPSATEYVQWVKAMYPTVYSHITQ